MSEKKLPMRNKIALAAIAGVGVLLFCLFASHRGFKEAAGLVIYLAFATFIVLAMTE